MVYTVDSKPTVFTTCEFDSRRRYKKSLLDWNAMRDLLFKINTEKNYSNLSDDDFVKECMELLTTKYPEISGYQYERINETEINLLIWGDI